MVMARNLSMQDWNWDMVVRAPQAPDLGNFRLDLKINLTNGTPPNTPCGCSADAMPALLAQPRSNHAASMRRQDASLRCHPPSIPPHRALPKQLARRPPHLPVCHMPPTAMQARPAPAEGWGSILHLPWIPPSKAKCHPCDDTWPRSQAPTPSSRTQCAVGPGKRPMQYAH